MHAVTPALQVLRQAMYEQRRLVCRYDQDEVLSVIKRDKVKAEEDRAATPVADMTKRLWYGDTPLILQEGGDFLIVRMTDQQLKVYRYHRQQGCTGVFMDATEGLVSAAVPKHWEWPCWLGW